MAMKSKRGAVIDEETGMRGRGGSGGGGIIAPQARRKGIGVRAWLVVTEAKTWVEEVEKHSIMRRTGLPARDLRALDPAFSYPSSILGRERAIVVNLEHIKAVITAKEVLFLNSTNPLVVEFVRDLEYRLSFQNHPPPQQQGALDLDGAVEGAGFSSSNDPDSSMNLRRRMVSNQCSYDMNTSEIKDEMNTSEIKDEMPNAANKHPGPNIVPFEFRALEACLESACKCLESETNTLEEEAYPALDELTSKISTLNLDRARQIKSRLVTISGRVQKVRDELEHLLDDDSDMAEMYLTKKLAARLGDQVSSGEEVYTMEGDVERNDDLSSRNYDLRSESSSSIYTSIKLNTEELEMLLEAYFVQIDGILQKLSHMKEYVDDTEDFINITLDDKQNQLLQMGVMLSTATMIINAGIVVVGLFGMNIHIDLFDATPKQFCQTAIGTIGACVALYLFAVSYGKQKNLIEL